MGNSTKIDLITFDKVNDEFALYLVEAGPWADKSNGLRRNALKDRINQAVEIVICGSLAMKFPDSMGRRVRVQVDLHDNAPVEMFDVVAQSSHRLNTDPTLQEQIKNSDFVESIRLVTREEMGR